MINLELNDDEDIFLNNDEKKFFDFIDECVNTAYKFLSTENVYDHGRPVKDMYIPELKCSLPIKSKLNGEQLNKLSSLEHCNFEERRDKGGNLWLEVIGDI